MNVHHLYWNAPKEYGTGNIVFNEHCYSQFILLNDLKPTKLPRICNGFSTIDLRFVTTNLKNY